MVDLSPYCPFDKIMEAFHELVEGEGESLGEATSS